MSRHRLLLTSLLAFAGLSCEAATSPPADPTGVVEGTVRVEGSALSNVGVGLSGGGVPARSASTDASGRFSFGGLAAGMYMVQLQGLPGDADLETTSGPLALASDHGRVRHDFAGTWLRDVTIDIWIEVTQEGAMPASSPPPFATGEGEPPGAWLTLTGPESAQGAPDSEGHVRFEGIRRGSYEVGLSGFDPERYDFENTSRLVEAPSSGAFEVRFQGSRRLEPPTPPTELNAVATGPTNMRVSWSAGSGIVTSVELDRSSADVVDWQVVASLSPTASTFDDGGLEPGQT